MLDKYLVERAVRDKILDKTFSAIVESCFIGALPFSKEDMQPQVKDLMGYADTVLESLVIDGKRVNAKFDILANALESETDPQKEYILSKIASVCMEAAVAVSKRVSQDDEALNNASMDDILESVGLDKDERDDFNKNVSGLNLNNISKVIQDKVIDVLKTEKKEEEEAAALEDQLKEAVTPDDKKDKKGEDGEGDLNLDDTGDDLGDDMDDSKDQKDDSDDMDMGDGDLEDPDTGDNEGDSNDDGDDGEDGEDGEDEKDDSSSSEDDDDDAKNGGSDDDINININIDKDDKKKKKPAKESMTLSEKAVESFYAYRLSPFHAKAPISFLSKLTDYAVESIMRTADDEDKEIPMAALYRTTFSHGLPFFDKNEKYEDIIQEATLDRAIEGMDPSALGDKPMIVSIIVYTVMETLKTLNLFSPTKDQIASVVRTSAMTPATGSKMNIAREEIGKRVKAMQGEVESAMHYQDVTAVEYKLSELQDDIDILESKGDIGQESLTEIHNCMDKLQLAINKRKNEVLNDDSPIISSEVKRVAEESARGIAKLTRLYGKHPLVASMEMTINSAVENYIPQVVLRSKTGSVVNNTFIDVNYKNLHGDSLIKALSMGIESATQKCNKPLSIVDIGQNSKVIKFTI